MNNQQKAHAHAQAATHMIEQAVQELRKAEELLTSVKFNHERAALYRVVEVINDIFSVAPPAPPALHENEEAVSIVEKRIGCKRVDAIRWLRTSRFTTVEEFMQWNTEYPIQSAEQINRAYEQPC